MQSDFIYPKFPVTFRKGVVDWDYSQQALSEIVQKEIEDCKQDPIWRMANKLFKDDHGNQWEMSPAELAMFKMIFKRQYSRCEISSCTQYGKTLTISRALLCRLSAFPEDWLVTEPDTKRGKILMNYIIKAASENDYFKHKLIGVNLGKKDAMNRLLEEKSKLKLTFKIIDTAEDGQSTIKYSSIEILTTEAHRKNDVMNGIMGFGGRNVVTDESSLIADEIESGIFRMLAGKGEDTFYLKIGNPFYRNHFFKSWLSSRYKKVFIDYRIGLADGRYTETFIEEAKEKPKFSVLFEAKFPDEGAVDKLGYMPLVNEAELDRAYIASIELFGTLKLGCDVAGAGRNYSTIVLRGTNGAKLLFRENVPDPFEFASIIASYAQKLNIQHENITIDMTGMDSCYRKARELLSDKIVGYIGGNEPEDKLIEQAQGIFFLNLRAQSYWRMAQWIMGGGKLEKHTSFDEILDVKYKVTRDKFIKIISKEEMADAGIESPDVSDALMMTFCKKTEVKKPIYRQSAQAPQSEYGG